ncbi:DNA-3-methyladenine glycosylase I [Leucobacter viscericola]|uniref:DNA-3-methyladenine glycosylase I n=1 Tax=Leucobacter viscericola TaxID=2714935 RepID=A0A6G7XCP9_9MICO|nr:DNA-3-methyladenine glycosylase I [Leucobacter viscericola]QIK62219.1 DNA-3-methyladenine glycosylase I [Leucobacter viscericola]
MPEATSSPLIRAAWANTDPLMQEYYDTEWGMPVRDEAGVFERLTLEAFQAGLSWSTILRRREGFRSAFVGFDVDRVAEFDDARVESLMQDTGIIRNRRKIEAAITNAQATQRLREEGTDLAQLVWAYQPQTSPSPVSDDEVPTTSAEATELARELKRRGFSFVGPTMMYALMTAIGIVDVHLVTSHRRGCSGLWNIDGTRAGSGPGQPAQR